MSLASRRMNAILAFVRSGHPLYDLCCDHGLIGLQALSEKGSSSVVFVDQSARALHSVQNAIAQFAPPAMRQRARVLCSPAQACVIGTESSDIIIAGVGVQTIIEIIDGMFPESLSDHRLILAPQQKSQPLRLYLQKRGFALFDEKVVSENGRFREIIVVEQQGEAIDLYGHRIAQRLDAESQAFVLYLRSYYQDLENSKKKS